MASPYIHRPDEALAHIGAPVKVWPDRCLQAYLFDKGGVTLPLALICVGEALEEVFAPLQELLVAAVWLSFQVLIGGPSLPAHSSVQESFNFLLRRLGRVGKADHLHFLAKSIGSTPCCLRPLLLAD
eukprot:2661553-Karenia_brevis.AAC.1